MLCKYMRVLLQDGGKWASSAVPQSASPRALANPTCIGGSGSEEIWMAPGDAARRDESCSTAGGDFLVGFWAKTCWRRAGDCVREQTRLCLPSIGTFFFCLKESRAQSGAT